MNKTPEMRIIENRISNLAQSLAIMMSIRQPIVSVLGHVDHGKTTLLDTIRGSSVVDREAGKITQHIGATEVPIETIKDICGKLLSDKGLNIPGLLFIDTPGHHAFTTLRARGGTLADIAVLIIDINEGIMPQTKESIHILRQHKTPFVIAANKVDRINGWEQFENQCFMDSFNEQDEGVQNVLDDMLYKLVGQIYEEGLQAERYDRISDFTKNIAIIPISAKSGEGVSDLLMVLIGLAQRFLGDQLEAEEGGTGEGTILEVKEDRGLGTTIDTIIFNGVIRKNDTIVVGTSTGKPLVTKVKALLKPKPLDEIRDPRERFNSVLEVSAAAGVKISAPNLLDVIAGAPVRVVETSIEDTISEVEKELQIGIETGEDGVLVKADAIGSLEALAFELNNMDIQIKSAAVGDISRRDIVEAQTIQNPLKKVLFAFNVKITPEAKDLLEKGEGADVELFEGNVIYKLVEDYQEWLDKKRIELENDKRAQVVFPGMVKILPDCIFRVSKPAIIGVRVLAGRIRAGQGLLRSDGRVVGKIKSIQSENKSLKEGKMGDELAISIPNATVGRQFKAEDILYIDIPEAHITELSKTQLSMEEKEVLDKVIQIKRKEKFSWGM
jgi:translation initiation factor 5B